MYLISPILNGNLEGSPFLKNAAYWIETLHLKAHPEGGYFRQTYRSDTKMGECCLGSRFGGARSVSTAIYFLLNGTEFSGLHRIRSDEIWHHYTGTSLTIHIIDPNGEYQKATLGKNPDRDEAQQVIVPARSWFGATVDDSLSYALVGCTVAPGFEFQDFEMGRRDRLLALFPRHKKIVEQLTR